MTRAGIITLVGKPNAGKSTLLNRLIGVKLSIVSPKPQSTRDRIVGIRTEGETQMILLDTPGLFAPQYPLQHAMRGAALEALRDADVVLYLADATDGVPVPLSEAAAVPPPRCPVLTVLNKVDALSAPSRAQLGNLCPDFLSISAATGEGIDRLLEVSARLLPETPFLYPADDVSTHTVRFLAGELVRETALEQLDEEVPYSVACEVEEFRDTGTPIYIRAVLYVERDSQKGILVGCGGKRIREIGRASRRKIEVLLDGPVYLDLWVKVLPNWRRSPGALRRFGYRLPLEQPL